MTEQHICCFLKETDGITCNFNGAYALDRDKPSLALLALRNRESLLQCLPALSALARLNAGRIGPIQSEEITASGQKECSRYVSGRVLLVNNTLQNYRISNGRDKARKRHK